MTPLVQVPHWLLQGLPKHVLGVGHHDLLGSHSVPGRRKLRWWQETNSGLKDQGALDQGALSLSLVRTNSTILLSKDTKATMDPKTLDPLEWDLRPILNLFLLAMLMQLSDGAV